MKALGLCAILLCLNISFSENILYAQSARSPGWVTAYYKGWSQGWYNNGVLPAEQIDYSAITHIIHFALWPNGDGTLDTNANGIRESNSAALVTSAHRAGIKVLISVGGGGSNVFFRNATSPTYLLTFVSNLIAFINQRGYDGIDIDWETLDITDSLQYVVFIQTLRQQLDASPRGGLLTAAVVGEGMGVFPLLAGLFDQINVITYDLSWPWPGWVTWYNAPLYDGGKVFPGTLTPLPSADGIVRRFLKSGVPASKLAIGIDFYAYIWSGGDGTPTGGVTGPAQAWTSTPWIQGNVLYSTVLSDYYRPEFYRWDSSASAAYLSIDSTDSSKDKFISYDDETACRAKVQYVHDNGLGGIFIWELGGGYLPESYPRRDRLLQAVKNAVQSVTGVTGSDIGLPREYSLGQNYPNPFNPATVIRFSVAEEAHVTIEVFTVLGQRVATLVDQTSHPGVHTVAFQNQDLPTGVFFYRMSVRKGTATVFDQTRKMLILR
jgi:chitinase